MSGSVGDAIQGLLIDLDGTLADSLPALRTVYSRFLLDHGARSSESEFDRLNGLPLTEVIRRLQSEHGLGGSPAELEREYLERISIACEESEPSPGAIELLRTAADEGYRTAVVTSGHREAACAWLERTRLAPFVHAVVGGRDTLEGKPSPAPYRFALERISSRADRSIAIEDSRLGAQAAVAAGLSTYVLAQDGVLDDDSWPEVAGVVGHLREVAMLL